MKNKGVIFSVVLIIAVTILLFLHFFGPLKYVEDKIIDWSQPITKRLYSWQNQVKSNTKNIDYETLQNENQTLENKLNELLIKNTEMLEYKEENAELRTILDFTTHRDLNLVVANILSQSSNDISKTFIIDQGVKAGIKKGQAVIINEGLLVGKIIEAQENSATFRLITDAQSIFAANVLDNEEAQGMIKGQHQLSLLLDLVPQTETLELGQTIVTSRLDPNAPPNIIIGLISEVITEPGDLFQKAIVKPQADIDSIKIIAVITS